MMLLLATCTFLFSLLNTCHGFPRIHFNNNTEKSISADIKISDPNSDLMIDIALGAIDEAIVEAGMDPMDLDDQELGAIGFEASVSWLVNNNESTNSVNT